MSTAQANPPNPKRRWGRFSLRSLLAVTLIVAILRVFLVFVTVVAIGCGWFAFKLNQAREQRQAAEAIGLCGGDVLYDYACYPSDYKRAPEWLIEMFGIDFCQDAIQVSPSNRATFNDADLKRLQENLKRLPRLHYLDVTGTDITDSGLKCLEGLTHLEGLLLSGTKITDAGLEHVKDLCGLDILQLSETSIDDHGLACLTKMNHLRFLGVVDTMVTDAGIENLKRALPNLHVIR